MKTEDIQNFFDNLDSEQFDSNQANAEPEFNIMDFFKAKITEMIH